MISVYWMQVWCDAAQESGEVGGSLTISLGNLYYHRHTITATVENYEAVLVSNFSIEEVCIIIMYSIMRSNSFSSMLTPCNLCSVFTPFIAFI